MIVVDTSLVLDLILRPGAVPPVPQLGGAWHAPSVLDVEAVSVIRGHLLSGQLTPDLATGALADYVDLGVRIWPLGGALRTRMLQLAANLSAYDAAFVALAEALDAPLVTRDRRLASAAPPSVGIILA